MFERRSTERRTPVKSHEVVAVMRYKGILDKEPETSNQRIATAAHYMMIKTGTTHDQLTEILGTSSSHYVQHRKLKNAHFKVPDLDKMGEFWDIHPAEFVYGYVALAEADAEDEKEEHG